MRRFWDRLLAAGSSNWGLKLLSLAFAIGLWIAGQKDAERSMEVPVEFRNIPSDLMITDTRVDYVLLRVAGPRTLVTTLGSDNLKLTVDLDGVRPGVLSFPLSSSSFQVPRGIQISRISPSVLRLKLDMVARKNLPVVVHLAGKPPDGYRVARSGAFPETVKVQGPATEVQKMTSAETAPLDLEEVRGQMKREVRLAAEGRPITFTPDRVTVSVFLEEEKVTREFHNVAIKLVGQDGADTKTNPSSVYLRLRRPKLLMDKLKVDDGLASIDLKGMGPGRYRLPLDLALPKEVEVVEQKPKQVRVIIPELKGSQRG